MRFLVRFGAASGLLAAFCIALPSVVEAFAGETLGTSLVLAASPALAAPLLIGIHIGQGPAAGRVGDAGFAVNLIGLGLFGGAAFALNVVVFPLGDIDLEPASRLALLVSAAVFIAGVVLFGAGMLRAGRFPRPASWLYLVGFPPFALAAPLPDTPLTSILHVVVGIALGWLAVALWKAGSSWDASGSDRWTGSWQPAATAPSA